MSKHYPNCNLSAIIVCRKRNEFVIYESCLEFQFIFMKIYVARLCASWKKQQRKKYFVRKDDEKFRPRTKIFSVNDRWYWVWKGHKNFRLPEAYQWFLLEESRVGYASSWSHMWKRTVTEVVFGSRASWQLKKRKNG